MEVNQFLAIQENRKVVRAISLEAVTALAPSETRMSKRFIEPLLNMVAKEETISAKANSTVMGLGGLEDLVLLVVVPVVTQVMVQLLTKARQSNLEALKAWAKRGKESRHLINVQVIKQADIVKLRRGLVESFSQGELRDLCFDLGVDYECLPGEGKGDQARELITYLERRGRISELWQAVSQQRPNVFPALVTDLTMPQLDSSVRIEITIENTERFVVDTKYIKSEKSFQEIGRAIGIALQNYLLDDHER